MARDSRYSDNQYDPYAPLDSPYLPDDPEPRPGDPGGLGYDLNPNLGPFPNFATPTQDPVQKDPDPDPDPTGPSPKPTPPPVLPPRPIGTGGQTTTGGGTDGSTGAVAPIAPAYQPPTPITPPSATLPTDIASLFTAQPTATPVQSAYQDALLKYMNRAQQTPSLDDPMLAPQVEVYRAQQQRNQERNRRVNAERAAATGQSASGYLDNLINQGVQQQGMNTAVFNAQLLGGEMGKRREELQAALQLARATGDNEAARELQTRLAQASAAMQQQGLNLQGQLGNSDLALRLMQTYMGNDQFYDQLGINSQLQLEQLNQAALRLGLGGL